MGKTVIVMPLFRFSYHGIFCIRRNLYFTYKNLNPIPFIPTYTGASCVYTIVYYYK